jgi:hypothetical protein
VWEDYGFLKILKQVVHILTAGLLKGQ